MKQRVEITFETKETIVLREGPGLRAAVCPFCGVGVLMASPLAIAAISNLKEREVFRILERSEVHFVETDRLLICMRSLGAFDW